MINTFTIAPENINTVQLKEKRVINDKAGEYAIAYVGPYSYCWNLTTDNAVEFTSNNS